MANDLTRGNVIIADTVGLLWKGWVKVRGFEYIPNAAGNAAVLTQYKTASAIANTTKQITGTITSTYLPTHTRVAQAAAGSTRWTVDVDYRETT